MMVFCRHWLLLLWYIVVGKGQRCPCVLDAIESEHYQGDRNANLSMVNGQSLSLVLCVIIPTQPWKTLATTAIHGIKNVGFFIQIMDHSPLETQLCNVQLHLVDDKGIEKRHLCPGQCRPIPRIDLSYKLIVDLPATPRSLLNTSLTCTLTMAMLISPHTHPKQNTMITLSQLIQTIFWRRIMECYENKFWQSRYTLDTRQPSPGDDGKMNVEISRRSMHSLVIWIGSKAQYPLINEQAQVLTGQPFVGSNAVIGWAATDETYPCRKEGIRCESSRGHWFRRYLQTLPTSAVNFMPPGWACAQRRPLRALAHLLTLLDPLIVILLDDDTLLNYPLLMQKYGSYLLHGAMAQRLLLMGELGGKWGELGHVTKWGMFAGGAGYIMGKHTIQTLTTHAVKYYDFEGPGKKMRDMKYSDAWRSRSQIHALSVFREAWERSEEYCDVRLINGTIVSSSTAKALTGGKEGLGNTCVLSNVPTLRANTSFTDTSSAPTWVPLAVRLIDVCVHLMAHENTCHHSDHSIGRCLIYGAYADPVNSGCHSTAPAGNAMRDPFDMLDPTGVKIGLCFMAPVCNISEQITCHRYKPRVMALPPRKDMTSSPRTTTTFLSTPITHQTLSHHIGDSINQKIIIEPVKISSKRDYYKVFSSAFNGSFTDSFM